LNIKKKKARRLKCFYALGGWMGRGEDKKKNSEEKFRRVLVQKDPWVVEKASKVRSEEDGEEEEQKEGEKDIMKGKTRREAEEVAKELYKKSLKEQAEKGMQQKIQELIGDKN